LGKQEELLYDEHDKLVNLEKTLAHEKEKNKILSKELVVCNSSISSLKHANDDLSAKIVKLNECHASSSSIEHVLVCNRCKDVDSCISNVTMIASLNDEISKLSVQDKTCKDELEKLKYASGAYLSGRHPMIKDGIGFQRGTKENTKIHDNDHNSSKFIKEKGKAPMIHNVHSSCANVAHNAHIKNTHISHAMIASTSHSSFA
jgi:hypothetical protein